MHQARSLYKTQNHQNHQQITANANSTTRRKRGCHTCLVCSGPAAGLGREAGSSGPFNPSTDKSEEGNTKNSCKQKRQADFINWTSITPRYLSQGRKCCPHVMDVFNVQKRNGAARIIFLEFPPSSFGKVCNLRTKLTLAGVQSSQRI